MQQIRTSDKVQAGKTNWKGAYTTKERNTRHCPKTETIATSNNQDSHVSATKLTGRDWDTVAGKGKL